MLICLNDLFACLGLDQTRKLLTNFSKNSFYLLPEPLRRGYFLTNYCKSNQHRQMAKVKKHPFTNILSQKARIILSRIVFRFMRRSCSMEPESGKRRTTHHRHRPLYDFFGEKEVPWESHLNHIRKVVVAHGITYIGFQAFSYCKSLSSVQLPDTLTGIGQHAFAYCKSLPSVLLPEGVKHIKDYAFCALLPLAGTHLAHHTQKYR